VAVIPEPGVTFPLPATPADLASGHAGATLSGRRFELFLLVPDGVARVVLQIAPPTPGGAGRPYALGAPVKGDLAAFTLSGPPLSGGNVLWLDRHGRLIKRIPGL
jgi:hypothetical protein